MTVAFVAVVLLLVGLPALAWWVSGRAFWGRLRPGRDDDPYGDMVRKHHLGTAGIVRVESAMRTGTRLESPAERAAVVDWARTMLDQQAARASRAGHRRTVALAIAGLWASVVVGLVVVATVQRRWGDVPWSGLVIGLAAGGAGWWQNRALRRAIAANSDE